MLSYAHGACADPLLGETIGHNLERTIARVPDSDALDLLPARGCATRTRSSARRSTGSPAGCSRRGWRKGDRVGVWSPNRAEWTLTQYATAKLGVILVNINPAYRTSELEYALGSRAAAGSSPPSTSRTPTSSRWSPTCGRSSRSSSARSSSTPPNGRSSPRAPATAVTSTAARRRARLRRPDQHPVHERHDRLPQGRDAHPPQHPQQRLLRRRDCSATPRPTASASRCRCTTASGWCSATSAATSTAPAWSTPPRRSNPRRPCGRARRSGARASTACRRCSSPSSTHRAFRRVRPRVAADRDHGRLAVPDRGDEARQRAHGDRRDRASPSG